MLTTIGLCHQRMITSGASLGSRREMDVALVVMVSGAVLEWTLQAVARSCALRRRLRRDQPAGPFDGNGSRQDVRCQRDVLPL